MTFGGSTAGNLAREGRFPVPAATARGVLWAVGDGADAGPRSRALARVIAADAPTRVLYLGDVYERGTAAEFAGNFAGVYGPLKEIMLPTPGNHDWPRHREGYDRYWAEIAGGRPPHHYALRLAGWQLISLNSEGAHGAGSRQARWLRSRLRGGGDCRLVFWHRPRHSAGGHGDQDDVAPLWRLLKNRARLVLNGHDHNLQWLRRRDGITTLIAGAGGRSRYAIDHGDERLVWGDDSHDGALRLELAPGRARFAFVSSRGEVLRRGRVGCRPLS